MATEIKMLSPNLDVTLIHSRDQLLSAEPLPDEFKNRALDMVREMGVKVLLGHRVLETTKIKTGFGKAAWKLKLNNGAVVTTGHVINAISKSIPTSSFLPTTALDSDCYVKINDTYESSIPRSNLNADWMVGSGSPAKLLTRNIILQ
jgi:thioredoxin reductase